MRRITVTIQGLAPSRLPGEDPGGGGPPAEIPLSDREAHHVRDVLRLKRGQRLQVTDGTGRFWEGVLTAVTRTAVVVALAGRHEEAPPPVPVTLAVALTKKGLDDLVRKAVELGVARLVPIRTAYTVKGLVPRPERWQRIAIEAAKQSGRAHAIRISEIMLLEAYAATARTGASFVGEHEARLTLLQAATAARPPYTMVIGPEGGFSPEERNVLREAEFSAVTLGPDVMRTETAAIAAGAVLCAVARAGGDVETAG